jgi:hypothetical protein
MNNNHVLSQENYRIDITSLFLFIISIAPFIYIPFGLNGNYFYTNLIIFTMVVLNFFTVSFFTLIKDIKVNIFIYFSYMLGIGLTTINLLSTGELSKAYLFIIYAVNIYFLIDHFNIRREQRPYPNLLDTQNGWYNKSSGGVNKCQK